MNEWCEKNLTYEQRDKVIIASIKSGIDMEDYFTAIEERYFDMSNVSSDNSLDPGIEVVINEVIEQFKEE
jgi:hypothetical protein